jgi:hypothetical protein
MFDSDSLQAKLGRAGETIVLNYFSRKGVVVEASIDQYDSQKDMIVKNKKIEVKTQVPFVSKDSFSFKQNQLKKCLNADWVFFVSIPTKKREHFSTGKVYAIESKKMQYSGYQTKDGRDMILIPIKQESMKELFSMTEEECKILQRYSVSEWN